MCRADGTYKEVGVVSVKSTILDPSLFQSGLNLTNLNCQMVDKSNVGLINIFLPFGTSNSQILDKIFLSSPSACRMSGASKNRDCVINGGDL